MKLSYRTRCALKRAGRVALVLLVVAVLAYALWFIWLNRFVVYSREAGASLDFSYSITDRTGIVAEKPEETPPVSVFYNDGQLVVESEELTKIKGYYVTASQLEKDLEGVLAKIVELPKGTAIMIDVKSAYGNIFYSSAVRDNRAFSIDPEAMDRLIETINGAGLYTIARMSALKDREYGVEYPMQTMQMSNGYGWPDNGYYWINPAKTQVQEYLIQLVLELRGLGFREVVFSDYRFPDTDAIAFNGDKKQTLYDVAQTIVKTCTTDSFTVSFEDGGFGIPEGRTRIYAQSIAAEGVEGYVEKFGRENADVSFVFITEMHDTRYEQYSVLRPLK